MTPRTFAKILEDHLKRVEDAVTLILNNDGDRPELDSLRGHPIDILDIVDRNPGSRLPRMIFTKLQPKCWPVALVSAKRCRETAALSEKRVCG